MSSKMQVPCPPEPAILSAPIASSNKTSTDSLRTQIPTSLPSSVPDDSFSPESETSVFPVTQLGQYLHALLPLPPSTPSTAEHARKLLKDRPNFFFTCEIPHSRKYVAVSRCGLVANFDSASLRCISIAALCGDSGSVPPPLLCATVTAGYSATPPPITIDSIGQPIPLSSPSRRALPPPRGDVLAAVTCHSVICLYDLAIIATSSVENGLVQPMLKISLGHEVRCPRLRPTSASTSACCSK
jgi:hypothetical protein